MPSSSSRRRSARASSSVQAAAAASSATSPDPSSSISFFSRLSQDASNAFSDAYGNFVLGDDAGKSARLVLVLKPKLGERIHLGMTFIEINGRAYVKSVQPHSQAARAGVLPRDSIQFASLYHTDFDDTEEGVSSDLDESATSFALACEARGMRISYDELRRLLAEGLDPMQSAFLSPPTNEGRWTGPPIPTTINICAPQEDEFLSDRPLSPFRGETPKPVVFVLRRTRQRSSAGGGLNFRMDDECDFAASLIKRLAPTNDMEMSNPDAWDELFLDGTDWLLGRDPLPESAASAVVNYKNDDSGIPLDDYERKRAMKIASLKSRMAADSMNQNQNDNVEAATIRGMIQKAVGLAFVRASKVVLGVSLHGGSGIVIARLGDGTWSAPSAIGTWGLGFGLQFGLEVAEYIFILQTQESLDHFKRGSSFNIGGNVGAAVAGIGREAYGAASVGNTCTRSAEQQQVKEDEYNDEDSEENLPRDTAAAFGVAPIVAYAKSQGLYVGVSLEGSRIFTRSDVNARAYKFATGRELSAKDILSGKVATPPEAEDLYAALHSVEFTHEMSCLPRPPEILRTDSANSWQYNRSTLGSGGSGYIAASSKDPFPFLTGLSREEEEECDSFETQFKKFMYGGVSVQRLLPNLETASGKTRKERRTLWLMLPEVGSLRLGFVSKLSDGEGAVSNKSSTQRVNRDTGDSSLLGWEGDLATVASEEITLDSVLLEKDTPSGQIRSCDVQLSNKHSLALTDVTLLSQHTDVPIQFSSEDKTEHLRVISIQDISGTSLLFLANNFREAELLFCGLKLLLERETARLGVRGGLPITALGGKVAEGAMSPAAARGFKEPHSSDKSALSSRRGGYASSEIGDESTVGSFSTANLNSIPEGRKKWGNVPGRDYMREKANHTPTRRLDSANEYETGSRNGTKYVHGQPIMRDIATNVHLPLPLPLCRVLLLDSSSPVIEKWEKDRGDKNFTRTDWTFPPATPRELERHASEHQLIASGSMMGAHRTTSFDRLRNGSLVHLSETQIIDGDDSEKLAFTISERMPRRGFSMKVKFVLRSSKDDSCEATVVGEVRPVGKNMSNQAAVHKAFLLVLNELRTRYGSEGKGLVASFLSVVSSLPNPESAVAAVGKNGRKSSRGRGGRSTVSPFRRTTPSRTSSADSSTASKPKKTRPESGLVSFDDIMNASHDLPPPNEPVRRKEDRPARPATPSLQQIADSDPNLKKLSKAEKEKKYLDNDEFADLPIDEQEDFLKNNSQPKTIEVKPLPKIRLSLMPAPREEDEENDSDKSPGAKKKSKKSKSSRRNLAHSSSSSRTSSRASSRR